MRVVKKNNVNIHWWGNTILLIHSLSGVCVCDDVETVFLEYLEKTNSLEEVITTIAQELGLEMEVMNRFADVFLENYKNFFDILNSVYTRLSQNSTPNSNATNMHCCQK